MNLKSSFCFAGQVIEAKDLRDEHVLCLKALHRVITDSVLSACFLCLYLVSQGFTSLLEEKQVGIYCVGEHQIIILARVLYILGMCAKARVGIIYCACVYVHFNQDHFRQVYLLQLYAYSYFWRYGSVLGNNPHACPCSHA